MNITLISANFGGFDDRHPVVEQKIPRHDVRYYYATEQNTPHEFPGLSPRMKAKFFKAQPHRLVPDTDIFIWHDASVGIDSPDFVQYMLDQLAGGDLAIGLHPKRPNLEEELLFIRDGLRDEDPYLVARYDIRSIEKELESLRRQELEHLPLYACTFFALHNSMVNRSYLDNWWEMILTTSLLDQCIFTAAFRFADIRSFIFSSPFDLGLLTKHPHAK